MRFVGFSFFLNRLVGSKDSLGSLGFGGLSEGFLGILWDWLVYSKDLLGLVSLFEEFLGILWDSLGFIDLYEGFLGILWDWLVYSKDPLGLASLLEGFSGIPRDFLEFSGIFWDFFWDFGCIFRVFNIGGTLKGFKVGQCWELVPSSPSNGPSIPYVNYILIIDWLLTGTSMKYKVVSFTATLWTMNYSRGTIHDE